MDGLELLHDLRDQKWREKLEACPPPPPCLGLAWGHGELFACGKVNGPILGQCDNNLTIFLDMYYICIHQFGAQWDVHHHAFPSPPGLNGDPRNPVGPVGRQHWSCGGSDPPSPMPIPNSLSPSPPPQVIATTRKRHDFNDTFAREHHLRNVLTHGEDINGVVDVIQYILRWFPPAAVWLSPGCDLPLPLAWCDISSVVGRG